MGYVIRNQHFFQHFQSKIRLKVKLLEHVASNSAAATPYNQTVRNQRGTECL